jgi:pyruvate dehydrogenase E1 component beta subunit
LVVADTATRAGSIAGELISQVVEQAFDCLKARPVRIASPEHPAPTSHFMSEGYYPAPKTIADAVLELLGKSGQSASYEELYRLTRRSGPHDTPNREFRGPF